MSSSTRLTTDDGPRFLWSTTLAVSDVFFKLISWLLVVGALKYMAKITQSQPVSWIAIASQLWYGALVIPLALFLLATDSRLLGFKGSWIYPAKGAMLLLSIAVLAVSVAPQLYLDQIIDRIASSRGGP